MRYYTYCLFTPRKQGGYPRALFVNSKDAFLFHDTENKLTVEDLRLPLFKLKKLFQDALTAVCFQVDKHTIAVTFSLSAIPAPIKYTYWSWSANTSSQEVEVSFPKCGDFPLSIVENVCDRNSRIVSLDTGEQYENCLQLSRLSGNCPCPLAATGVCVKDNILPALPTSFSADALKAHFRIEEKALLRVEYATLGDFLFIKPAYSTTHDGWDRHAWRSWTQHSFSGVEKHRKEFSSRGHAGALRKKYVQAHCSSCVFANKSKIIDCGETTYCRGTVDSSALWNLLHKWYGVSGFDSMLGFTPSERNYLISLGGTDIRAKGLLGSSRTSTGRYSSFVKAGSPEKWVFRIRAANRTAAYRYRDFESYAALQAVIPTLCNPPPAVSIPASTLLLYALSVYQGTSKGYRYDKYPLWYAKLGTTDLEMYRCVYNNWYVYVYPDYRVSLLNPDLKRLYCLAYPGENCSSASTLLTGQK